jgi:lipopolysaccharide heptosyltransferase III
MGEQPGQEQPGQDQPDRAQPGRDLLTADEAAAFAAWKRDCREFRSERPCAPAKQRGKSCETCDEYEPGPASLCIVKLAAVGDVLRTTAFLPALKRRYPEHRILWLTHPSAFPILQANPFIDELLTIEDGFPDALASKAQDLVLSPDADPETAALAQRIRLKEGGRRLGFALSDRGFVEPLSDAARHWYLMGVSDECKRANRESYQNLVAALLDLPLPHEDRPVLELDEAERARARSWLCSAWPEVDDACGRDRLLGLNTGAGHRWPQKQWTLDGQVGLISALHAKGHTFLLLGGPAERARHAALLEACPKGSCIDAGTDNSLRDFAARLGLCSLLITGDTMALHMATAFAIPVVALFGPTSLAEIELYGNGHKLQADALDCLCCYSRCTKHPDCMESITLSRVLEAVQSLL